MNLKNIIRQYTKKVDEFEVRFILQRFVKNVACNMIIDFDVTKDGVINIYTNRPGVLIGCGGKDINELTEKMKQICNAKDVKVFEMKNLVSNCGVY